MEKNQQFIMLKSVDRSVLKDGFTIPVEMHELFYVYLNEWLKHGMSRLITIVIDGVGYEAKLTNSGFNQSKFRDHTDVLQIRYSVNTPIAVKLREVFSTTYDYVVNHPTEPRKQLPIPEELKEQFAIYGTPVSGVFYMETLCYSEQLPDISKRMTEEDFELNPEDWTDPNSTVEERQRFVKVRRLDHSVGDNLKKLYDYRCQISGEYVGKEYGGSVVEAHHIDYFVNSHNNDSTNIIILSPNFHRIIHKYQPKFCRNKLEFRFPNGVVEKIKLNKHL